MAGSPVSPRPMRLGRTTARRSRRTALAASAWITQRSRIRPWVVVGNATCEIGMRASSSSTVRGALPRRETSFAFWRTGRRPPFAGLSLYYPARRKASVMAPPFVQ